jgi:biopolymer transport protein ExbD
VVAVVAFALGAACAKPTPASEPTAAAPRPAATLAPTTLAPATPLVVELAANGEVRADGARVADGGLRDVVARTKTQDVVVLAAAADTPWRTMVPLLEASRERLASTGLVLAIREEPQRRTAPVGGAGSPKLRPPPRATPPAPGSPGGTDDELQVLLHVELKKDGPTTVDNEKLTGPLVARARAAKARGVEIAILVTSDDGLPLGAVVDATREVQAGGLAVAYAFKMSP